MAKRKTTIVKDINKMFPPSDPEYPICFIRDGESTVIVSGECTYKDSMDGVPETFPSNAIDYWGEFQAGCPWIDPKLEAYAEKNGGYWEWENAASRGDAVLWQLSGLPAGATQVFNFLIWHVRVCGVYFGCNE